MPVAAEENGSKNLPARRTMSTANPMAATMAARAHLECAAGPEKGQTFRVMPGVTVIGREPSCEVVLTETVISRQHTRIERRGENWVLVNLSANGTLVNKKQVDEAVLADGDEIRLGAKTRLQFVVESAAPLVSGRPQFRRRAAGQAEEETDKAEEPKAEEAAQPSLFRRRKGLFIGLAAYLAVVLVIAVVLAWGPKRVEQGILVLGLEDHIWPPGSDRSYPVVQRTADGYKYEPEPGVSKFVSEADVKAGKAVYTPGIRRALDVKYALRKPKKKPEDLYADGYPEDWPYVVEDQGSTEANDNRASELVHQALLSYVASEQPGKEAQLFHSVRLFQKALAHYQRGILPKTSDEGARLDALKKLIDRVYSTYSDALVNEKAGRYVKAVEAYQKLTQLVPDQDNVIYNNATERMNAIWSKSRDDLVNQARPK